MDGNWFEIVMGIIGGAILAGARIGRKYRSAKRWSQVSLLGRFLYGVLVAVICFIVWGVSELYDNWYYEKAPAPYSSVEAAAADGCVVLKDFGSLVAGEEHWEEFVRLTGKGLAAVLPVAIADGASVGVVDQLFFDGAIYHYTDNTPYIHQDSETESYAYLVHLVEEPDPEEGKGYSRMESWVLTNKQDLTVEELPLVLYEPEPGQESRRLTLHYEWLPEDKLFGP